VLLLLVSFAKSVVPARTLGSPTAGIGTGLFARREKIVVTRSGSPFERSPVPMSHAHRHAHAQFAHFPENASNLRLVGGAEGIRTGSVV